MTKRQVATTIFLVVGSLAALNLLSEELYFRLDFTADERYTLSDATIDLLESIDEPVTVTAYFSDDLPPAAAAAREDFRDLLAEYDRRSDGVVVFEFVNPNDDVERETEARQRGVVPVAINVRERDQAKRQIAYLGAVVSLGERSETIPLVEPGAAMEFALTSAIKKLVTPDKPAVAFIQGHGEPTLEMIPQAREQLSVSYELEPLSLDDSAGVPPHYGVVVWLAPRDSAPPAHLAAIDDFLARGGDLFLGINAVEGDMQTSMGRKTRTGVVEWLRDKGVAVEESFVVDAQCGAIYARQQQAGYTFNTPIDFPYFPIVSNFADHPATAGLEAAIFQFASPLAYVGDSTDVAATELAWTTDKAGKQEPPVYFTSQRQWRATDFDEKRIPLALALVRKVADGESRMIVVGDGDFAINGAGESAQRLQGDNVNLLANGVDWLADERGLAELRVKGVEARPIDPSLSEETKTFVKYLNFLLPVALVVGYGLFRANRRKRLRKLRQSTSYAD
ncbi:MAG: hypothetical protein GF419_01875 [Ignavibacteriales bacterium]|nr:hypothetical protein [Ignavibacteriales bacterium]